ncbi:MAG: hypothetical protein V2A79_09770 [Planctomycetota bacterium]
MADLTSTLNTLIKEPFPQALMQAEEEQMPILKYAQRTKSGITMTDGNQRDIGRLFKVKHGWRQGIAGMTRPTSPLGAAVVDIGTQGRFTDASNADGLLSPIPSAAEAPHVGWFTRELQIHANIGNMGIPLQWKLAENLSAMQFKVLYEDMQGCAEMTRRQDAISYFAHRATGASSYKVTVLSRITSFAKATHYIAAGTTNANFVDIVIDEKYGAINNFIEGMELDIVANSGGSATVAGTLQDGVATDGTDVRNYTAAGLHVQLTVAKVDRLTNTISVNGVARGTGTTEAITAFDDITGWQGTNGVANYDWICPRAASTYIAATRPWLTNGLNDWMADSGVILGGAAGSEGLDLAEFPQFKSLIINNLAGPLTEDTLDELLRLAAERSPRVKINALITTGGVIGAMKAEMRSSTATSTWNRTNLPFEVKGGWTLSNYVTPEGTYQWWTSPYCLAKTLYGQAISPENLKMYTPMIVGSQKNGFAEGIQFLGPLLGYPGIEVPEHPNSNGTPNLITGTPWIRFALLVPIYPQGIKVSGITETTGIALLV